MKLVALETGEPSRVPPQTHKGNKGISILDLVLRAVAIVATLASAVAMGTTNETLPIFNQFIQVKAQFNDLPTFTWVIFLLMMCLFCFFVRKNLIVFVCFLSNRFFVIVNSVVCFYLVVSLPMSIFHIVRSGARISRVILIFLDSVNDSMFLLANFYCLLFMTCGFLCFSPSFLQWVNHLRLFRARWTHIHGGFFLALDVTWLLVLGN